MVLRHIRPGTIEWDECTEETEDAYKLTPEEVVRLRYMLMVEKASLGMPLPDFKPQQRGSGAFSSLRG
jgi:hypothetical protein